MSKTGVDVVKMPQRLVMANSGTARDELKGVVSAGSGNLVIDLSETDFMDSSGLAVLVTGLQAARKRGGDVHLMGMNDTIRALFQLTRLHTVFQIFDTLDAAQQAFEKGGSD